MQPACLFIDLYTQALREYVHIAGINLCLQLWLRHVSLLASIVNTLRIFTASSTLDTWRMSGNSLSIATTSHGLLFHQSVCERSAPATW